MTDAALSEAKHFAWECLKNHSTLLISLTKYVVKKQWFIWRKKTLVLRDKKNMLFEWKYINNRELKYICFWMWFDGVHNLWSRARFKQQSITDKKIFEVE